MKPTTPPKSTPTRRPARKPATPARPIILTLTPEEADRLREAIEARQYWDLSDNDDDDDNAKEYRALAALAQRIDDAQAAAEKDRP